MHKNIEMFSVFLFFAVAPFAMASTVVSGPLATTTTWTLANSPYIVQGIVTVNSGGTLTIEPGVVVKFMATTSLDVYGTLSAQGTFANKIYFTSAAAVPKARDWMGIRVNGGVGNFNNVVVEYGGGGVCNICRSAGIFHTGGTVNISNSKVLRNDFYGIFNQGGVLTVATTEFSNQEHGIYFSNFIDPASTISQSSFHDNALYGILNNDNLIINAINNWWGSASGPYHSTLNALGTGNRVSNYITFSPWLAQDPILQLSAPSLSNFGQFKSDGVTAIAESGITTEDLAIFQATASDPANNQVKLEVELRPIGTAFSGADDGGIVRSGFTSSGSEVSVMVSALPDGQYRWRARAINSTGNVSPWQEFSTAGNTDFEIKTVPLYTQVESEFPDLIQTKTWSKPDDLYGTGNYPDCKDSVSGRSSIRRCGCAIASSVMMLRYHGVTSGADTLDTNPLTLNNWLNSNGGYTKDGNVMWPQLQAYSGGKVRFDGVVPFKDNATLDQYLAQNNPVILYQASLGHFILADGKLSSTYTVRDPKWYNTRHLTDASPDSLTRDYHNDFTSIRLFSPVSGTPIASSGMYISIASPAELLLTDSNGHKLGKNPMSGISYNEIPGGSYYYEGISAAEDNPLPPHESKVLWVPQAPEGQYQLSVIGTGNGSYTLDSLLYDGAGDAHTAESASTTAPGVVSEYSVNYAPSAPDTMTMNFVPDTKPPEAIFSFNVNNKKLNVEGVDDRSPVSATNQGNIYTLSDASGNTLVAATTILTQSTKALQVSLNTLKYNNDPTIALSGITLKYSWSLDHSGQLSTLSQTITLPNQISISAQYSRTKNNTTITVTQGTGKKAQVLSKQTLPGLVIITLRTKAGTLSYAW